MIIPWHVVLGLLEQPGFVLLKHGQIEERIDLVKLAGVNEAHKEIPDVGAMFGLEEVGILSMEDSFFQSLFTKIVVQWCSRHSEELGQGLPVLEHISDGLSHG